LANARTEHSASRFEAVAGQWLTIKVRAASRPDKLSWTLFDESLIDRQIMAKPAHILGPGDGSWRRSANHFQLTGEYCRRC
jgi:hypothetical protein